MAWLPNIRKKWGGNYQGDESYGLGDPAKGRVSERCPQQATQKALLCSRNTSVKAHAVKRADVYVDRHLPRILRMSSLCSAGPGRVAINSFSLSLALSLSWSVQLLALLAHVDSGLPQGTRPRIHWSWGRHEARSQLNVAGQTRYIFAFVFFA